MTRHILVVDDDGDVRDVIVMMLVEAGFAATAALSCAIFSPPMPSRLMRLCWIC
jgi:CheY-like chemotaxis protein